MDYSKLSLLKFSNWSLQKLTNHYLPMFPPDMITESAGRLGDLAEIVVANRAIGTASGIATVSGRSNRGVGTASATSTANAVGTHV